MESLKSLGRIGAGQHLPALLQFTGRKSESALDAQQAARDLLADVLEFKPDHWRMLNKLNAAVGLKVYHAQKGTD